MICSPFLDTGTVCDKYHHQNHHHTDNDQDQMDFVGSVIGGAVDAATGKAPVRITLCNNHYS